MMAAIGGIELEEVRVAFDEWPDYLKSKGASLVSISQHFLGPISSSGQLF